MVERKRERKRERDSGEGERGVDVGFAGLWDCGGGCLCCLCAARYKPVRVNNRPSDVIAPRDTSVAFKWLLSRLCLDADVDLWNSIKLYGIPYRPKPGRRVSVVQPTTQTHVIFFHACARARLPFVVVVVLVVLVVVIVARTVVLYIYIYKGAFSRFTLLLFS